MDHEVKSFLSWMFAWLGVPLLFAGVAHLTYLVVRYEPPSGHPADWVCIGIMLAFLAVGTFWVRERLRPRAAWVTPAYAFITLPELAADSAWVTSIAASRSPSAP